MSALREETYAELRHRLRTPLTHIVGYSALLMEGDQADDDMKAKAAKDAEAALADPLDAFRRFFLEGRQFVGGDHPSIADLRWAASLEFLRAIDYDFPAWTEDYMRRVEDALGEAYTEPAQDVRGYIASVKAQKEAAQPA